MTEARRFSEGSFSPKNGPQKLQNPSLRTRYYQRAFRAITTGHSNRRRTQAADFESLKISFPEDASEQQRLIHQIQAARVQMRTASDNVKAEMNSLSNIIDGRGQEELVEIAADDSDDDSSE